MALETVNRLFASVKADETGAILARSSLIVSVVRSGDGVYDVTLSEAIAATEAVADSCVDEFAGTMTVERVFDTVWRIRTFDSAGVLADSIFNFGLHRVSSSNGG